MILPLYQVSLAKYHEIVTKMLFSIVHKTFKRDDNRNSANPTAKNSKT